MPATPELGNRTRLIGRIEIDFKTIPHKQGYADSHIGITRKITVYLQGIAIDTHKILESGIEHGIVKNAVYEIDTNVVGDNYLFNQPAHDEKKTFAQQHRCNLQRTVYLRDKVFRPNYGTRRQRREKREVKNIISQTRHRGHLPPIHIYNIAQRTESEKRDTDGQHNIQRLERLTGEIGNRTQ